jgi:hypothetical protein
LRNPLIQKLRLHIHSLLSKEAKKLRLSQVQAKMLAKKVRLRLLPYHFRFLEPQAPLQIESLFPIRLMRNRDSETKNCGACALTCAELFITNV